MENLDSILPVLRGWASERDFVGRLWVYGSRVPGSRREPRPDSDLDVAIEILGAKYRAHYLMRHLKWQSELDAILPYPIHLTHYDVCVDSELPVEAGNVAKEVDRYGFLVYDRAATDITKSN